MPIWLISAIASAVLAFGFGWQTHSWKTDAAELSSQERAAKDAFKRVELVDKASEKVESGDAEAEARETVVFKEVIRVVQKPVYRERCLDDDGLRILSDDIAATNARRKLAPALPAASSASGAE